jgi:hypothetical protein
MIGLEDRQSLAHDIRTAHRATTMLAMLHRLGLKHSYSPPTRQ